MLILVILDIVYSEITKIAFGSCHGLLNQSNYQIFSSIADYSPDIFIWLGDTIYADQMHAPDFTLTEEDFKTWQDMYKTLKNNPDYQNLLKRTKVTGVYDDHDFGQNDADDSFNLKAKAQEFFMDFMEIQIDHEGIYRTEYLDNKIRLILLDVRYFKKENDLLGPDQWKWLETQLAEPYPVTFIISGLQINVEDRFLADTEKWDQISRARLLSLIKDIPGLFLLSGDIHFGEILLNNCATYPLLEVTSSGLSHTEKTIYGPLAVWFISLTNAHSYHSNRRVFEKHFAILEINWEANLVTTSLRDTFNQVLIEQSYQLSYFFTKIEKKPEICEIEPKSRHYFHLASSFLVFVIPVVLNLSAFLIFLRKSSHKF